MDVNSPEEWYRRMPPMTKIISTGIFIVTMLFTMKLIDVRRLLLDWVLISKHYQFWRLLTDYFFIGGFSFNWVFQMYFFTSFSSKLEENQIFSSSKGAYLYFLLLQAALLNLVSLVLSYPTGRAVMAPSLHFAIIYYWSRREPYAPVGLWGFTIQAYQLPFALLIMDLVMGGSLWGDVVGLFTGHFYYFLREILPGQGGIDVFQKFPCPQFLDRFVVKLEKFSAVAIYRQLTSSWRHPPAPSPTTTRTHQRSTEMSTGTATDTASGGSGDITGILFRGRGQRLGGN